MICLFGFIMRWHRRYLLRWRRFLRKWVCRALIRILRRLFGRLWLLSHWRRFWVIRRNGSRSIRCRLKIGCFWFCRVWQRGRRGWLILRRCNWGMRLKLRRLISWVWCWLRFLRWFFWASVRMVRNGWELVWWRLGCWYWHLSVNFFNLTSMDTIMWFVSMLVKFYI